MKALSNPPNPWSSTHVEWIDAPPPARLEVYEQRARSIVTKNDSPDVGFGYSVNPYQGCFHGCAYCYARPTHQYWDFGAGTDFERRLVVKVNAPELLRETFDKPSWKGEVLAFSGVTDCYQPLEASYGLTRRCLEVCAEYRNPVGIITKGALVRRDVDVLGRLAREARAKVTISIPFADAETARLIEPNAPSPRARLEALRVLSEAGIDTGVALAPIIPGLTDSQLVEILERAREAGARRAFCVLLRLPREVGPVFEERLREALPERADRVMNALRELRGGAVSSSTFGARMRGEGPRWEAIVQLFRVTCRRLGMEADGVRQAHAQSPQAEEPTTFRRPSDQLSLL